MYQQPQQHPSHHVRFYIVMITLVVGGIFVLLLMNNNINGDSGSFSFTSAVIGNAKNITQPGSNNMAALSNSGSNVKGIHEIPMILNFDKVPPFTGAAKVKEIVLESRDLTKTILVNSDKLELTSLKEVSLNMENFEGNIEIKEKGFSLSGISTKISVNGIALTSEKEIKVSFEDLDYTFLEIEDIELDNLRFEKGNGRLKVDNKLEYTISEENVFIQSFKGTFQADKDKKTSLNLNGVAQGIESSGSEIDLSIR